MPQMFEIQLRINQLLFSERANVTTAQNITTLYTISDEIKSQVKTLIFTNLSSNNIYYGVDGTVSTSNAGGVIFPKQKMEVALVDINYSPYFIADSSSAMGLEIWG